MELNTPPYQLIDNATAKQYEFHIDRFVPRIEYIKAKEKIYLTHTEVPKELAGKGIGTALVKQVLEDIKEKGLTLVPLCPFVALYLKRHPEWKTLVLKGINIG
ncbi:MAG: GNAT family N-acetyltransferase [Bacteroidota bacterium]